MKLFLPNNLSRRSPEFIPLNDPVITKEVVSLLEEHYPFPEPSKLKLSVFSGVNISSQNLKLETPAAKGFLKVRDKSSLAKMLNEAELTFALSELGQKVPRITRSRNGSLVSLHEEKCWVLYEFQDGYYFTGKGNELQAAAEAFGELSLAAKQLFPDPPASLDACPRTLNELLNLSELKATKYPDVAALCATHRSTILDNLAKVEEQGKLMDQPCLPMHLDYHPLNLLMNEDGVACIVDLEHLQPYPVAVGLGFAAYKLIRQAMVDDDFRARELNEHTAVSTWLRGWQKSFSEDRFTPVELGHGARCRILKLISLILDASLTHDDGRFNYDLEKQIFSLFEADVIFGV